MRTVERDLGDRVGRRRLRPSDAARADARRRQLRAQPARVHRALGRDARAAAPRPEGDAPGPDEPRRRARPARRGLGGFARRPAGALRARRPDGGAPRPARAGCAAPARSRRSPDARLPERPLGLADARGPPRGGPLRHRDGARRCDRADRGARLERGRACTGVRRPARAPAHAWARGRGDDRERHRSGRGRGLLRDPRDAEHRSGRRFGHRPRFAPGDRAPGGADPGRVHGVDLEGARGRGADRAGRARRRRRGGVHRRRSPGRLGCAAPAGAPVRRAHGQAARAPLRGADALARRAHARRRRLRRARARRLAGARRERDGSSAIWRSQPTRSGRSI